MRVFEEREKKQLSSVRKNTKLLIVEPPRSLFKVVVNNYMQQDKQDEEMVETTMSDQQGLPPQPAGYLKFPEYDWF
jgi:hypothetical protein